MSRVLLDAERHAVLQELAQHCRLESIRRYQVLGWWLPLGGGGLALIVLCVLPKIWLLSVVLTGLMVVFHRYHRWKLQQLLRTDPLYLQGRIVDKRIVNRGQRRSHGLMFPIELWVELRAQPLATPPTAVTPAVSTLWLESSLLSEIENDQEIGVLLVGDGGTPVVLNETGFHVSPYLALPNELQAKLGS